MSALGASGAGYTATIGDRQLIFMPWTQGVMDAFEAWLVQRVMQARMEMAEVMRRKGRKLLAEAKAQRERGMDLMSAGVRVDRDTAAEMQGTWEDVAGEGQQLQMEARTSVNEVSDQKAMGYFHFFGQASREARDQFPGRVKIAHLSLLAKQPGITIAEVEAMAKPGAYWEDLGDALAEANDDAKKSEKPADSTPSSQTTTSAATSTLEGADLTQKITP